MRTSKMREKQDLDSTVNSSVYKKLYKLYICKNTGKCTLCRWHGDENTSYNIRRYKKSWKKNSKRRNQYKIKEVAE